MIDFEFNGQVFTPSIFEQISVFDKPSKRTVIKE
jgi:hypothetical protein